MTILTAERLQPPDVGSLTSAECDKIRARAEEMAADAFDSGSLQASEWLTNFAEPSDVANCVFFAARRVTCIDTDNLNLDDALDKLRAAFVREHASGFFTDAEIEMFP